MVCNHFAANGWNCLAGWLRISGRCPQQDLPSSWGTHWVTTGGFYDPCPQPGEGLALLNHSQVGAGFSSMALGCFSGSGHRWQSGHSLTQSAIFLLLGLQLTIELGTMGKATLTDPQAKLQAGKEYKQDKQ